MAEHRKTITSISWNPRNPDVFATASSDCRICVWNVVEQKVIAQLDNIKAAPSCIGWAPLELEAVSYIYGRGPLYIWNYSPPAKGTLSKHLESMMFFSDVCQFRWHQRKLGKLAFGHVDGTISVVCPGQKPFKNCLRPESVEDADEDDPVTALEWDPLSTEYLLVSNANNAVRLIDSDSMSVIMSFRLPSVAGRVHSLSWVPTVPGMFVTGGEVSITIILGDELIILITIVTVLIINTIALCATETPLTPPPLHSNIKGS